MDNLQRQLNNILADPNSKTEYRLHAVKRIFERGISRSCVSNIIRTGEIIESYPDDIPFPSCLILGICEGRPFHIVIGIHMQEKTIHVITVYEPYAQVWDSEYRRRV
ncbi:DUF4258 domain-containing protein [Methanospirillum sp.]